MVRGELPITGKLPERLRWTQLVNIAAETGVLLNCKLMKKLNAVKTLLTLSLGLCLFQTAIAEKRPNVLFIICDDLNPSVATKYRIGKETKGGSQTQSIRKV